MAKKISIFGSAKSGGGGGGKGDKTTVIVDGWEEKLLDLAFLKSQLKSIEAQLKSVDDEIRNLAKEKFVELYKKNKSNPNTFYIKDNEGCVMVIPADRYISIKDDERADYLIENYGDDVVTEEVKYYFNNEVLERNMKAIEKLIMNAKDISDSDKENLLIKDVKYSVTKGTIDKLLSYGDRMEIVLDDIQPTIMLKNCGGKEMEDGGEAGENLEYITSVYKEAEDEYGQPTIVRTQFEEEEFEYEAGGNVDDEFEPNYIKIVVKDRDTQKKLENYLEEISNKYFEQVDEEEEDLDNLFNVSVFQDKNEFVTTFNVPYDDYISSEIIESIEEKFGDSLKIVPYYYEAGGGVDSPQEELDYLVQGLNSDQYEALCYEYGIDVDDANEMVTFIYQLDDDKARDLIRDIEKGYFGEGDDEFEAGGGVGRRTKNYKYIPNRMIQSAEVKKGRKVTEIAGKNILDGIYVRGKVKFEAGGGIEERFFVGQSIMFPITNNSKLDSSVRNWHNKYANKELVIEKIKANKPYNLADVFVRSTGEKIEDITLNPRYIQQYANGGGVEGNLVFRRIKDEYFLIQLLKNRKIKERGFISFSQNATSGSVTDFGKIRMAFDMDKLLEQSGLLVEYTPEFMGEHPDIAEYVTDYSNENEYNDSEFDGEYEGEELDEIWSDFINEFSHEEEFLFEGTLKYVPKLITHIDFLRGYKPSKELIKLLDENKIKYNYSKEYEVGGEVEQNQLTDEQRIKNLMVNGEISCSDLTMILGCEPNYPEQVVGSLKLTKCYLRNFYKI